MGYKSSIKFEMCNCDVSTINSLLYHCNFQCIRKKLYRTKVSLMTQNFKLKKKGITFLFA